MPAKLRCFVAMAFGQKDTSMIRETLANLVKEGRFPQLVAPECRDITKLRSTRGERAHHNAFGFLPLGFRI